MSRRRAAEKREILPDPKFGSDLIARFVNHVMKRGKKSVAENIVYGALTVVIEKVNKAEQDKYRQEVGSSDPIELIVFKRALDNVCPTVEVRSRRVGGATFQVPVEIRPVRRQTLAMGWLITAAKSRKEKTMSIRLAGEIMDALNSKGIAIKKRDDMHRMAEANKAFAHYRWSSAA